MNETPQEPVTLFLTREEVVVLLEELNGRQINVLRREAMPEWNSLQQEAALSAASNGLVARRLLAPSFVEEDRVNPLAAAAVAASVSNDASLLITTRRPGEAPVIANHYRQGDLQVSRLPSHDNLNMFVLVNAETDRVAWLGTALGLDEAGEAASGESVKVSSEKFARLLDSLTEDKPQQVLTSDDSIDVGSNQDLTEFLASQPTIATITSIAESADELRTITILGADGKFWLGTAEDGEAVILSPATSTDILSQVDRLLD